MKKILLLLFFLPFLMFSQDDLLGDLEAESDANAEPEAVSSVFKGLKIVNLESTKLAAKGDLYFIVSHRFGSIKTGIEDLFGLDAASTRINFVYGITNGLNIGFSRSKFNQTYEMSVKYSLVKQKKGGFPLNIVGYNQLALNGQLDDALLPKLKNYHRLTYTSQALISSKVTKGLSLELAPTVFHDNYVDVDEQDNTQFALGAGFRQKLTSRLSVNVDYGYHFNRASNSPFRNPLSVGLDIETGGHVFQLHFTNAQAMFESGYLGQASGDWSEGDIFFGFNLNRVF